MAIAKLVYASQGGNTEEVAEIVERALEENGIEVEKEEVDDVDIDFFDDGDLFIVATFTYSDGVPDEFEDFFNDLKEQDFSGKIFGVVGSGDTSYDHFGQAIDEFEEVFLEIGGIKGSDSVKVELAPEDDDEEALEKFAKEMAEKVQ